MHSQPSLTPLLEPQSAVVPPLLAATESLREPTLGARPMRTAAAAVARFSLHFLEMVIAMAIGMAVFAPVRTAMAWQGYVTLLDTRSLDYLFWMNLFMVVPMVLWMRVRGCSWRHGAEMGAAMVVPTTCVLLLCGLGITDIIPWFTRSLAARRCSSACWASCCIDARCTPRLLPSVAALAASLSLDGSVCFYFVSGPTSRPSGKTGARGLARRADSAAVGA